VLEAFECRLDACDGSDIEAVSRLEFEVSIEWCILMARLGSVRWVGWETTRLPWPSTAGRDGRLLSVCRGSGVTVKSRSPGECSILPRSESTREAEELQIPAGSSLWSRDEYSMLAMIR
jgi:hypothetical protein